MSLLVLGQRDIVYVDDEVMCYVLCFVLCHALYQLCRGDLIEIAAPMRS